MLSLIQAAALCPTSPTGKHHWMIPYLGAEPIGICKFCSAERQFVGSSLYDWKDYAAAKMRDERDREGTAGDAGN